MRIDTKTYINSQEIQIRFVPKQSEICFMTGKLGSCSNDMIYIVCCFRLCIISLIILIIKNSYKYDTFLFS